jgi:hypothetical protein
MKYPESVLTKNKKGEVEVRSFLRRGEFVEYQYLDPSTGKTAENGKIKLVLKSGGKEESCFIIPLGQKDKFLFLKQEGKVEGKLWDGKKEVKIWD